MSETERTTPAPMGATPVQNWPAFDPVSELSLLGDLIVLGRAISDLWFTHRPVLIRHGRLNAETERADREGFNRGAKRVQR